MTTQRVIEWASPTAAPRLIDGTSLRLAMGNLPTGVSVVTTTQNGHHRAMTANSFTSVSLDPALVLICVDRRGGFAEGVHQAGVWGVSLLPDHAVEIARRMAQPGRPLAGQLSDTAHHVGPAVGVALLDVAVMTFECRTRSVHTEGDHDIVVGEVLAVDVLAPAAAPMTNLRREFGRFTTDPLPLEPEPGVISSSVRVGTDVQSISQVRESIVRFGHRYTERLFTPAEVGASGGLCPAAAPGLAARFAAKEATIKVLRPVPGDELPPLRDIEIIRVPGGAPQIQLHDIAVIAARTAGVVNLDVSMSHDGDVAIATVVASTSRR